MSKEELGGKLLEEMESDPHFERKMEILKEIVKLREEKKRASEYELKVIKQKIETLQLELSVLKTKTASSESKKTFEKYESFKPLNSEQNSFTFNTDKGIVIIFFDDEKKITAILHNNTNIIEKEGRTAEGENPINANLEDISVYLSEHDFKPSTIEAIPSNSEEMKSKYGFEVQKMINEKGRGSILLSEHFRYRDSKKYGYEINRDVKADGTETWYVFGRVETKIFKNPGELKDYLDKIFEEVHDLEKPEIPTPQKIEQQPVSVVAEENPAIPETPAEPTIENVATEVVETEEIKKEGTPKKVDMTPKKSNDYLKVGDRDKLGFEVININRNNDLGTEFLSYVFKNNGERYFVEHTSYEGKDEGWKFSENTEKGAQYLKGKFDTEQEILDAIREDIENKKITEIAELLKTEKVSQLVFHSRDQEDPGKDEKGEVKGLKIIPDNDARLANYIFNNLNKRPPEEIYGEGAMSSFIPKSGTEENLSIQNKGLRIFIDAGGKWLSVEQDGKEIINLYIDHHGSGKRTPTSASEMMLKIMEKAGLLKEKPEWLDSFVKSTTEIDNLSYIEEIKKREPKGFDQDYFKNKWPNSLPAIAEKMSFDTLLKLFEEKKVNGTSEVFTKEELEGKLGKTKTETTLKWFLSAKQKPSLETMEGLVKLGKIENVNHKFTKEEIKGSLGDTKIEITIAELCNAQKQRANEASFGVDEAERYMKERKLNFKNTSLGKILFHNQFVKRYFKDGNPERNRIHNDMAYLATRAHGYDTLVNLDEKNKRFFVNSWISVKKIADKFGLVDIRGNFIFGSTANEAGEVVVGEKELLDTIDPEILKTSIERKEPKKPLTQEEQIEMLKKIPIEKLSPEQRKILLDCELKKREQLSMQIEAKKKEIEILITTKDKKIEEVEKKYKRKTSDDMSGFDEIPEPEEEADTEATSTNPEKTKPENNIDRPEPNLEIDTKEKEETYKPKIEIKWDIGGFGQFVIDDEHIINIGVTDEGNTTEYWTTNVYNKKDMDDNRNYKKIISHTKDGAVKAAENFYDQIMEEKGGNVERKETKENKIENNEGRDELFEQAAKLIVERQYSSTSLLQRNFLIGYNRAGRIIDQLETAGIIGPFEGSMAREVKFSNLPDLEEHLKKTLPQKSE